MPGTELDELREMPGARWFSFLSMAWTEMRASLLCALAAALALGAFVLLRQGSVPAWMMASPALAFLGATFWGWVASYRRLQALEDYPLSKIASAPQGYVRLEGRAALFPGKPLESPLTHRPCCWYSYRVVDLDEERRGAPQGEHETSPWSFMMEDGSGECVVDPAGAQLVPVRSETWRRDKLQYTEQLILPGDRLFVLGRFATAGAAITDYDIEFQVGQLMAGWKKDMRALLERFDLDRDGRFSEQEWALVRAQARREVEAGFARNPPQPQNNVSKPDDERPYLISAESRQSLERNLAIWAWIHLGCFVAGIALLARWALR